MTTKTPKPKKPPVVYPPLPIGAVLLALDVSSSATGIAVGEIEASGVKIHSFGVARPPSSWSFDRKVGFMADEIDRLIAFHKVSHVVFEWQDHRSGSMRVQGLAVLGQAQGALWNHLKDFKVDRVPVREATKLRGRNVKKQTRCEWVKTQVTEYAAKVAAQPNWDKGSDASDALFLLLFRAKQGV
ncbi:MAG: hypothetical protein P4L67_04670 [Candidatus Pacebacteria bacterium]|nr:hypothetical protein [Candidatus Paceibacterota bacterium]